MSIIGLQRRLAEVGRIRIGQLVPTQSGGSRPAKLDTFRLTSPDRARIDAAAQLFGGTVEQWQAPAGPQWQVITERDYLHVIVPPADMAFTQHYELWSAGGCQRRCDGVTEQLSEGACMCDPDNRECDIHTRLSVMLRDLPGLGVWRIDTQGYYAAVELEGAVHVIEIAAGKGVMLPARLRLEQRQVKRQVDGKPQTRKFAVPMLDVDMAPGQLLAGPQREQAAITDGQAYMTPVPAQPQWPVPPVGEQAGWVDQQEAQPRRVGAAQPIRPSGLAPRTAAEAAEQAPGGDAAPVVPIGEIRMIDKKQIAAMGAAMRELGITDRQDALNYVELKTGRRVQSRNELTHEEASVVIDAARADLQGQLPGREDGGKP